MSKTVQLKFVADYIEILGEKKKTSKWTSTNRTALYQNLWWVHDVVDLHGVAAEVGPRGQRVLDLGGEGVDLSGLCCRWQGHS